jgi:signal transduction histidine kinase
VSLRHRFFWATLGASALAACLFLMVATILLTPRVAHRLVEQDARIRLLTLAGTLPSGDGPVKDAYLRRSSTPGWNGVELVPRQSEPPDNKLLTVTVPLAQSSLALSITPPVSVASALAVARPSLWRVGAGLLGFVSFVYFLTWGLSRFVTQPLQELQAAVTALSDGERNVSVILPQEEELAELASSFNRMAGRLRDREQDLALATQRLEKALETKERIFANTSHELRTPLTVILGYAQMLQDGLKGALAEDQAASVAVIERNAKVLLGQVEDLLTLSRLQAGQLPLNWEPVDLKDLVDEVASNFKPLFESQELEVSWSREGPFPAILDYQRGCQILSNLLENARRYANGAPVTVHLRDHEHGTDIEVKDSGPGIPAELVDTLFVEFERGAQHPGRRSLPGNQIVPGRAADPRTDGAGLGLALARGLARQFGGELALAYDGEEGAKLIWTVPAKDLQGKLQSPEGLGGAIRKKAP